MDIFLPFMYTRRIKNNKIMFIDCVIKNDVSSTTASLKKRTVDGSFQKSLKEKIPLIILKIFHTA